MCRNKRTETRFRGIICIFLCFEQYKMLIIPLNLDSVLLFLHNSKLAYCAFTAFCPLRQTRFLTRDIYQMDLKALHHIFRFQHCSQLNSTIQNWKPVHQYTLVHSRRLSIFVLKKFSCLFIMTESAYKVL